MEFVYPWNFHPWIWLSVLICAPKWPREAKAHHFWSENRSPMDTEVPTVMQYEKATLSFKMLVHFMPMGSWSIKYLCTDQNLEAVLMCMIMYTSERKADKRTFKWSIFPWKHTVYPVPTHSFMLWHRKQQVYVALPCSIYIFTH